MPPGLMGCPGHRQGHRPSTAWAASATLFGTGSQHTWVCLQLQHHQCIMTWASLCASVSLSEERGRLGLCHELFMSWLLVQVKHLEQRVAWGQGQ